MINLLVVYARFSLLITIVLYILGAMIIDKDNKSSKRDFIGFMMILSATMMVSTILVYRFSIIGLIVSICAGLYIIYICMAIIKGLNVKWKHPRLVKLTIVLYLIIVLVMGLIGGILKNPNGNINFDEEDAEIYKRSIRRSIIRNIR